MPPFGALMPKFTQAIADEICGLLESGLSLRAACEREGMPTEGAVRLWARDDHKGFATQYARAREIGYSRLADEILEIADEEKDDVNRSRLRVDSRKWMLSKVLPKIYGDKLDVNTTGTLTINVLPRAAEKEKP